jgi:hypothetical protein
MKIFCGISFAWTLFVLLNPGFGRRKSNRPAKEHNITWQQYDSLATVKAFNGIP